MSFNDACNSGNPIIKPSKKDKYTNLVLLLVLLLIVIVIVFFMYY